MLFTENPRCFRFFYGNVSFPGRSRRLHNRRIGRMAHFVLCYRISTRHPGISNGEPHFVFDTLANNFIFAFTLFNEFVSVFHARNAILACIPQSRTPGESRSPATSWQVSIYSNNLTKDLHYFYDAYDLALVDTRTLKPSFKGLKTTITPKRFPPAMPVSSPLPL